MSLKKNSLPTEVYVGSWKKVDEDEAKNALTWYLAKEQQPSWQENEKIFWLRPERRQCFKEALSRYYYASLSVSFYASEKKAAEIPK